MRSVAAVPATPSFQPPLGGSKRIQDGEVAQALGWGPCAGGLRLIEPSVTEDKTHRRARRARRTPCCPRRCAASPTTGETTKPN